MKKIYLFVLALVLFFAGTGAMHITKNEPKPAKQLYCCAEQIETDCSECSVCVVGKASKMIVANSAVCFVFKTLHIVKIIALELAVLSRSQLKNLCCQAFDETAVVAYENNRAAEVFESLQQNIF